MVPTYYYDRIEARGFKGGRCAVCGKNAERSRTFGQTLNPFNRDDTGAPKTAEQINREVIRQVRAWEAEPVVHARCEGGVA